MPFAPTTTIQNELKKFVFGFYITDFYITANQGAIRLWDVAHKLLRKWCEIERLDSRRDFLFICT
jgi:hypothetical protein